MAAPANLHQLVIEMGNWDKDKRFMAASDLTQEIINCSTHQSLDQSTATKVCQAFLTQLEDQSIDVQGNAVKCLAKIVGRFGEQQITDVMGRLASLVLDAKAEVRDIYATCLKGLIFELHDSCSTIVCQAVIPKMLQGITQTVSNNPATDTAIKEECTDVLHDLLKRFGENKMWFNEQEPVSHALLNLLSSAYRPSVRKRAIACIGVLSAVMSDRQLHGLIRVLLQNVRNANTKSNKQMYIQCVGTVGRNVGFRIGSHLSEIAPLFLSICGEDREGEEDTAMDGGDAEAEHEVVENCLTAIESFVIKCTHQMVPYLDQLIKKSLALAEYDPNYYAGGDDDDEMLDGEEADEYDDEGLAESDDDDTSWKVRRAALKVLSALIRSHPDRLEKFYTALTAPLVSRLKEREENVRLDVFNTVGELVKAAVVHQDTPTGPLDFESSGAERSTSGAMAQQERNKAALPRQRPAAAIFIKEFERANAVPLMLRHLRNSSLKTRQGALQLFKTIAQNLPTELEPWLPKMLPELVKGLQGSHSSIRLDALVLLFLQAEHYQDASVFQGMAPTLYPIFLKLLDDSYYKIAAQSLRVCGAYVYALRPDRTEPLDTPMEQYLHPLWDALQAKLTQADIDQEVKECALYCFGHMLAVVGDVPAFAKSIDAALMPFVDRLKNEVTRKTALASLKTVCASPLSINLDPALVPAIAHLSSLLNNQSRSFRQICLDVLVALVRKYGPKVDASILNRLLEDCTPYVKDTDLHIADLCMQLITTTLATVPATAPVVAKTCMASVLTLCRSPILQGHTLVSILDFFGHVVDHPQHFPHKQVFTELSDVSPSCQATTSSHTARQILSTLAKCLAQFVVKSPAKTQTDAIKGWLKQLTSASGKEVGGASNMVKVREIELAVLALGETGRLVDLSKHKGALEAFLGLFHSPHEEIRSASAIGLGYATCGAMSTFLKVLVGQIHSSDRSTRSANGAQNTHKTHYLLLTSLREVVAQHHAGTPAPPPAAAAAGGAGEMNGVKSIEQPTLTEHLKPHVNKVLPILVEYASSEEESDRTVVAECLGQILLLDPVAVSPTLAPLFDTDDAKSRTTAVSALRFAAAKQCDIKTLEGLQPQLMRALTDSELMVRKAALQTLNVVCVTRSSTSLLSDVQMQQNLVEQLFKDTQVDQKLIREVDLGPFKHKVDDGLPVRKAAYTALASLLNVYPDTVASGRLMDFIHVGLADHEDVQVLCCQILTTLAHINPTAVIQKLEKIVDPLDKALAKALKQLSSGQEVERVSDALRLYTRTLQTVHDIPEARQCQPFQDFLHKISRNQQFQAFGDFYSAAQV